MKIDVIFNTEGNYYKELFKQSYEKSIPNIKEIIEKTLQNHPFKGNLIEKKYIELVNMLELSAKIGFKNEDGGTEMTTCIGYENYPQVILWLDEDAFGHLENERYSESKINENIFGKLIIHEFGHLYDYLDINFNIDSKLVYRKRELIENNNDAYRNFIALWNVYIDGRIWPNDKQKLQDRIDENPRRIDRETVVKYWNAKNLTYHDLINEALNITKEKK